MSEPLVSVVIASVNGLPVLAECLEALMRQEGSVKAEILVADRCGEATRQELLRRFPSVRLLPAAAGTPIPALRAMAAATARGRLVAVLEDHCNADRGWLTVIARTYGEGHRVFGGSVANGAAERTIDWAAFFCEYARFMPPLRRGTTDAITGNNTVYERELLAGLLAETGHGLWEPFLHARLRELGIALWCEPELMVSHRKQFGFLEFLGQRYHYSRSFAGLRLATAPPWKRALYACATAALPLLLLVRILREVAGRRRYWPPFARALPLLLVFLLLWGLGEAVGTLFGPGRSLEKVE